MALFSKKTPGKGETGKPADAGRRPVVGRAAFCRICNARRQFSKCWLRVEPVRRCPCCGKVFENSAEIYKHFQPTCPACGEFLEQPGFEYGHCDGCRSKYELVTGAKPGLLPNKQQRAEMNKVGRARSID